MDELTDDDDESLIACRPGGGRWQKAANIPNTYTPEPELRTTKGGTYTKTRAAVQVLN